MKITPVKAYELTIGDIISNEDHGHLEVVSIKLVTKGLYEVTFVSDTANNTAYHRVNGGSIIWYRRYQELMKVLSS